MKQNIKALRLARSMSQKRLAHEAGIDVRTLRRIESGIAVSPESFRAVCIALRIEPSIPSETTPPDPSPLAHRLDALLRTSVALSRSRKVRVIAAAACILSVSLAVYFYTTRPNVSISIAFDRACDERGVFEKAFMAMDREFPRGYVVTDRINGAKDCAYRFDAYLNRTGSLRRDMFVLLRNLEHVGTKTTVSVISSPSEVVPRSKESWDDLQRTTPTPWSVSYFARRSYKEVFTLNHVGLEGDVAYARSLFADQASYDSHLESLKVSRNLEAIARSGFTTSVSLPDTPGITAAKDTGGVWTVRFPARITYSAQSILEQCLDVTMRVKDSSGQLGILNIISKGGECSD
ncbi:helix-turn-helix domain-containing protein [Pararhizobium sp. BT-229]|uniref:helix-turn-helix domain-containing protein n=1 Tax=Pararhizobium sp. BT-229 TaxID=2986923 RepID=UPI0021F7D2C6|nr:helix-turn-helix domain-containing protein [Pararhizobium sp. BT-229]MCV9965087.1 helix-turn-helix domain-containing protein [Pararhizobium sp. BT-229]